MYFQIQCILFLEMSSDDNDDNGIVLDNGCGNIKAGFASEAAPRCSIPNIIGSPISGSDSFVGDKAQNKRDVLKISCPMSRGIIQHWDDMERIWNHVFDTELHSSPNGRPVFISETPLNPKANREGIAKIMFEHFNVSSLYIAPDPVLSMYAHGSISGLVYTSGDAVTSLYPIYEGFPIPNHVKRIEFGGLDITESVSKSLCEKGYNNVSACVNDMFTVRDIKERLCYVPLDYEHERKKLRETAKTYTLPDGQSISLDEARFQCVEPMFQPSAFGLEHEGQAALIRKVIMDSDIDLRKSLCDSIILSGGNTKFPGFAERVKHELSEVLPTSLGIKVRAPQERSSSVWIGMSIVATMSNYKGMWISKQSYDENGPSVIHRNSI